MHLCFVRFLGTMLLLLPALSTAQEHSHNSHATTSGHDHSAVMEMTGDHAPTLIVAPVLTGPASVNLTLDTTRFEFSKAHADSAHIAGEGHARLYLDGEKLGRVYSSPHTLDALPAGVRHIRLALYTNDHAAYVADGAPVASVSVVKVPGEWHPSERQPSFDVHLHGSKPDTDLIRVNQGDLVTLRMSTRDAEPVELHLHGYDISAHLARGEDLTIHFVADVAGRFPVAVHGGHDGGQGTHATAMYLEVYPD